MTLDARVGELFFQLLEFDSAQILLGRVLVTLHLFDNSSKIALKAVIYQGDRFIPKEVKNRASKKLGVKSSVFTTTKVDSENHAIYLAFLGTMEGLTHEKFKEDLIEFHVLVEKWRSTLKGFDSDDLIKIQII